MGVPSGPASTLPKVGGCIEMIVLYQSPVDVRDYYFIVEDQDSDLGRA